MKILLPTSIALDDSRLPLGPDDVAARYDPTAPLPEEHVAAEVLVAWGNTDAQLADAAARMGSVRLVQSLAAGPDQIARAGFRDEAAVCSGVGLHDRTVTEHALALVLALVRSLPRLGEYQRERRWAAELTGPQELHPADRLTTLLGARVTIWGFGSIGATLAPLLTGLGAHVSGIARSTGERHGYPVVATEEKDELLARTDVLIMVLPSGEGTDGALDAAVLRTLPSTAYVVNVGRGTTVDEAALISALQDGVIGGAALDVTAREPLPAGDPLWDAPNLLLTPHTAGNRPVGAEELIGHNVEALRGGGELRNAM
ncbi:phosphoglycerate dehydrogenase [Rothia sp. AR01]|uniref:Phosphoglycerate dehydrogenase n=1 Tax=Rothia santali TaxID=2949643 RepID=A0A9X2KI69_9MICC|nr:phosphoglycerate dehydrogenase [Rothia santali]MCP3426592.1 phosphoglycerate dehydrogenase [Rothia santali]